MKKVKEWIKSKLKTLKKWVHSTIRVIFLGLFVLVFVVINHLVEYYYITYYYSHYNYLFQFDLEFNDQLTFVFAFFGFWLAYIRMTMTDKQIQLTEKQMKKTDKQIQMTEEQMKKAEENKRDADFNTALQNLNEDKEGGGLVKNYGAVRSLTEIALQDKKYYHNMLMAMWVFLSQKRETAKGRHDIGYFFRFIKNNHYKKERPGIFLTGANLMEANLIGVILMGAILNGADLRGADLTGADFSHADLSDTNFEGAMGIKDVTWTGAYYCEEEPKGLPKDILKNLDALNIEKYRQQIKERQEMWLKINYGANNE